MTTPGRRAVATEQLELGRLQAMTIVPEGQSGDATGEVPRASCLLEALRGMPDLLYGLFDAARDEAILSLLSEGGCEFRSLYEGDQAVAMADYAPYLVRLPPDATLLECFVRQGWGESWGVYLTSPDDLSRVRHHFRHYLMAELPHARVVYFRFYDPRVLRVFLPTCSAAQVGRFFGAIRSFIVESEGGRSYLEFRPGREGVGPTQHDLGVAVR
jgi:hypothetical protein